MLSSSNPMFRQCRHSVLKLVFFFRVLYLAVGCAYCSNQLQEFPLASLRSLEAFLVVGCMLMKGACVSVEVL